MESKGSRTMGSEWPDKRDKTGFGSVARGVCVCVCEGRGGGGGGDIFVHTPGLWGGLSNGTVLSSPYVARVALQRISLQSLCAHRRVFESFLEEEKSPERVWNCFPLETNDLYGINQQ